MLEYEQKLYEEGYEFICGTDEAGRGPLIGPVVAGAVILPKNYMLDGLTDSKKLREKKREKYFEIIKPSIHIESFFVGYIFFEKHFPLDRAYYT